MNEIRRIPYVELIGDQCGGAADQDGKFMMLDHAARFREVLEERGVALDPQVRDLSAEARYTTIANGDHEQTYGEMCEAIMDAGIALKAPTETSKPTQVAERIARMEADEETAELDFDPSDETKMGQYRRSPNDVLRNGVKACAIVRDHEPIPNLYEAPVLTELQIMAPDLEGYMELSENGEAIRILSGRKLFEYAYDVVKQAKVDGKSIVVMGKYTISEFEEKFTAMVESVATFYNVPAKRQLSDSALPGIVRGEYEDVVIAALPDVADRMQKIAELSMDDVDTSEDIVERMQAMRVFRCATGFGYGGELSLNGDFVTETYIMDPVVVRDCTRLAMKDAERMGVETIAVVLPHPVRDHEMNGKFLKMVEESTGDKDLHVVTCGEMFADIVADNTFEDYQVVISGNADGDHITDLAPALQVGALGKKLLGVGESRIIAVDPESDDLTITTWIAEASAGTAPTLEPVEKNAEILPAGFLLSICRLLAEHPDYEEHSLIGRTMHDAIMNVLNESGADRDNWIEFVDEAANEYDKLLAS